MIERRLRRGLMVLLATCLCLAVGVAYADREEAAEMAAYWEIVGGGAVGTLAEAMDGDVAFLTLGELKAVTTEELLAFAAEHRLPVSMVRHAWYTALADRLQAALVQGGATQTEKLLSLFLAVETNSRDSAANAERRSLRKAMTEADIVRYAAETGLPAGFLAWLMLDDEWYESDWDDGDDWREGRRSWHLAGWVEASDLREIYGADAVVTEDDVERLLRQHGLRFDD